MKWAWRPSISSRTRRTRFPGSRRRKRWPISSSRWGSAMVDTVDTTIFHRENHRKWRVRGALGVAGNAASCQLVGRDFCEFTSPLAYDSPPHRGQSTADHHHFITKPFYKALGLSPKIGDRLASTQTQTGGLRYVEIFFADFAEATWGTTRWPVFVGYLISEVLWVSSGVVHWFRLALPHGCYYVK